MIEKTNYENLKVVEKIQMYLIINKNWEYFNF